MTAASNMKIGINISFVFYYTDSCLFVKNCVCYSILYTYSQIYIRLYLAGFPTSCQYSIKSCNRVFRYFCFGHCQNFQFRNLLLPERMHFYFDFRSNKSPLFFLGEKYICMRSHAAKLNIRFAAGHYMSDDSDSVLR